MIGALAGDIIGSVYEWDRIKTKDFPLFSPGCCFTDDSTMTLAVAKAILEDGNYLRTVLELGRKYPHCGYGGKFKQWIHYLEPQPYNSFGNGSAMRASPVGFAFDTVEDVLKEAERSAAISHNHPEGIKGAQATALAVFLARTTHDKERIREEVTNRFVYDLSRTVDDIRPDYSFDGTCQGTVPEAIVAFLDSTSYEDAIRNAISLGGDSDTLACITGGIAEAYYGPVSKNIKANVQKYLTPDLWYVAEKFYVKYV